MKLKYTILAVIGAFFLFWNMSFAEVWNNTTRWYSAPTQRQAEDQSMAAYQAQQWNQSQWANWWCDWVSLNTDVPYVGKCLRKSEAGSAFPVLMSWLSKIVITLIMVIGFLMILIWWVLITASGASSKLQWDWKALIMRVVTWIILLWISWMILHAINPNFFK